MILCPSFGHMIQASLSYHLQPSGLLPKDRRVDVNFPKKPHNGSDQRSQHNPILDGACSCGSGAKEGLASNQPLCSLERVLCKGKCGE